MGNPVTKGKFRVGQRKGRVNTKTGRAAIIEIAPVYFALIKILILIMESRGGGPRATAGLAVFPRARFSQLNNFPRRFQRLSFNRKLV